MKKEIGIYIDRAYKVVRQDLINRFKTHEVDLTPEQWVLLSMLEREVKNQTDLANGSFRDKHTVSRILDLLTKKGYVRRQTDPEDGRRFLIHITEEGKYVMEDARPHVYASREKGWQDLSEDEYEKLRQLLDKVFMNYLS